MSLYETLSPAQRALYHLGGKKVAMELAKTMRATGDILASELAIGVAEREDNDLAAALASKSPEREDAAILESVPDQQLSERK